MKKDAPIRLDFETPSEFVDFFADVIADELEMDLDVYTEKTKDFPELQKGMIMHQLFVERIPNAIEVVTSQIETWYKEVLVTKKWEKKNKRELELV